MVTLAVAMQPLAAVTVTTNVPAVVTSKLLPVVPPVQTYEGCVPLATNVVLGVVQLKAVFPLMVTDGIVLFRDTATLAVAVQPFAPVAVTV